MKRAVLISAISSLVIAFLLPVFANSFKEWRIEKNTKEIQGLEKRLRETKDDFYLFHSPLLATRIYHICDDLRVAEGSLAYWKSLDTTGPIAPTCFIGSIFLFLLLFLFPYIESTKNKKVMKNENQIEEICHKEGKVLQTKEWLGVLFFVAAIIVAIIYYKAVSGPKTDHGESAAITIIITFSTFASLIIAGYFYKRYLLKKLDRLFKQKSLLS